jgi:hypothetical protein
VEGEEVQHLNAEEEIGEEREKAEEDTRMHEDEESKEDSRSWIMAERQEQEMMASSSARALRRLKAREMMGYAGFGEPVQNDEKTKSKRTTRRSQRNGGRRKCCNIPRMQIVMAAANQEITEIQKGKQGGYWAAVTAEQEE